MWPFEYFLQCNDIIPEVKSIFIELVAHTDVFGNTPMHDLAGYNPNEEFAIKVAKLIMDQYKQVTLAQALSISEDQFPWLRQNKDGETPLTLSIKRGYERLSIHIMSLDNNTLMTCLKNPLMLTIKEGCLKVAKKMLEIIDNKGWSQLLSDDQHVTALHVAPLCKDETFFTRLLKRYPDLLMKVDNYGSTVLHNWLKIGEVWMLKNILHNSRWRSQIVQLIISKDYNDHNNAVHVAAFSAHEVSHQAINLLVEAYKEENLNWRFNGYNFLPWFANNRYNEGPLHLAMRFGHDKLASYISSLHHKPIYKLLDAYMPNHHTLCYAIEHNCSQVAKEIMENLSKEGRLEEYLWDTFNGQSVLHLATSCTDRDFVTWLVSEACEFITKFDNNGQTPLDVASNVGGTWLIQAILEKEPSALVSAPLAWVKACENGHVSAIRAFIDYNPGQFRDLCIKHKDSPLHHIQLSSLDDYEEFLKISLMKDLINLQDCDGVTPLHKAILNQNINLVETLLNMDKLSYKIKDKDNGTAIDLLDQVCKKHEEWDNMCQRIGFDPRIKTTHFQREANLIEVRGSLFIVSALLATITFTAGFTISGGFNQVTGVAILAKSAAFLVFLISDTLAMCCSMLVLVCLIWSTTYDTNKSLFLIDRSMKLLMLALYCTLLAFMTGVYVVISPKSLWAAIFVIVLCALVGMSAKRSLLHKLLDKLIPSTQTELRDQIHQVELGISKDEGDPLLSETGES